MRSKTLVVSYLPRGERSHTKKLLDTFLANVNGDVEHLDLLKNNPDFFDQKSILAYIFRNFMGEKIDSNQTKSMTKMDMMTNQLKNADKVVLAFPMYNFSMPGIVKTWFDSVMLKGETWDMDDKTANYKGLLEGKKALVLMASGGMYDNPQMADYEHAISLANTEFKFMGFDEVKAITAGGMNMVEKPEEVVAKAQKEVETFTKGWYAS